MRRKRQHTNVASRSAAPRRDRSGHAVDRVHSATTTVAVGATVTFDFGSVAHNVFFDAHSGAPPDISGNNANTSVGRTFNTAGSYSYTCHIHPSMHGTVIVQ